MRRKGTRLVLACALGLLGCDPKPHPGGGAVSPPPAAPPAKVRASPPLRPSPPPTPPKQSAPLPVLPVPKQVYRVAALGDSITDGRHGGGGYLKVLQKTCPESVFHNFGRGGDMTNQMLRRFRSDVLPVVEQNKLDTLLVYGGVNDLYSDLTAGRKNNVIERDLSTIYELAKRAGLRVVALTVSPWGGFSKYWNPRRGENTELLNSWILGQVETGPVDVAIDTYPLLSCGILSQLCKDYENRSADGLHPGPKGHQILGEKLKEVAFADCR